MKTLVQGKAGQQQAGGLAALYMAMAYLVAMPYFLIVVHSVGIVDPAEKVALMAGNLGSMYAMHLISYVIFGIVLAILALALHARLKDGMPATMQAATAVGLLWAFVLVASGMIFNSGMGAVTTLYPTQPAQALSAWQAIEPVALGLSGVNGEILGGLWILLVSWAALRTGRLPRALSWLGLGIGLVGILSVVPALKDAAYVFGLLQIVWLVWLGIVMMRTTERQAAQMVPDAGPAQTLGGEGAAAAA
jgi:hypothetical protein